MTAALLDRLLHHADVGESYQIKDKRKPGYADVASTIGIFAVSIRSRFDQDQA